MNWYEEALYDRYKALYGYVFYTAKNGKPLRLSGADRM